MPEHNLRWHSSPTQQYSPIPYQRLDHSFHSHAKLLQQEGNGPIDFGRQGYGKCNFKFWWPWKPNLTLDLKLATLITLVSIWKLPLAAILITSKALAAHTADPG